MLKYYVQNEATSWRQMCEANWFRSEESVRTGHVWKTRLSDKSVCIQVSDVQVKELTTASHGTEWETNQLLFFWKGDKLA